MADFLIYSLGFVDIIFNRIVFWIVIYSYDACGAGIELRCGLYDILKIITRVRLEYIMFVAKEN
jgi:hypothetical protein